MDHLTCIKNLIQSEFKVDVLKKIQSILLTLFCERNKCTDRHEEQHFQIFATLHVYKTVFTNTVHYMVHWVRVPEKTFCLHLYGGRWQQQAVTNRWFPYASAPDATCRNIDTISDVRKQFYEHTVYKSTRKACLGVTIISCRPTYKNILIILKF